jgi:hypothetical protein
VRAHQVGGGGGGGGGGGDDDVDVKVIVIVKDDFRRHVDVSIIAIVSYLVAEKTF